MRLYFTTIKNVFYLKKLYYIIGDKNGTYKNIA